MELLKGFTPRKPKIYDEAAKYYCIEQSVRVRGLCNTIMHTKNRGEFIGQRKQNLLYSRGNYSNEGF